MRGPVVKSSGNVVNIDDKYLPNTYYGNLFIGSELLRATVIYDTVSDWTVVTSAFDIQTSETRHMQIDESTENATVIIKALDLGMGMRLEGPLYTDNMCLIHTGEPADISIARLCVK